MRKKFTKCPRQFFLLTLMVGIYSCTPELQAPVDATVQADANSGNTVVMAYVFGDTGDIEKYPVHRLTHIIYSFLHLDGNELSIDKELQSGEIRQLVALKEKYPDLKIIVALGGWGGCASCSDVFSTSIGRDEFVRSAVNLMTDYQLDGLDLDWEYPAIKGFAGHTYKPDDRKNFTALVKSLRKAFSDNFELSFAAGAGLSFLQNSIEWELVMPLVDHVNLMTYDLVTGESEFTGHHTPLYSTAMQEASADYAVRYLVARGVDPGKIVIGAAFYARVWANVNAVAGSALYQGGDFKEFVAYKDLAGYFDGEAIRHWDNVAKAAYRYNASTKSFATFDDRQSVALKAQYAIDEGLGGIMFWQLSGDTYQDGLLDTIADVVSAANSAQDQRPK